MPMVWVFCIADSCYNGKPTQSFAPAFAMSQEQGAQLWLRFSSVDHPKCSMNTFLARQPVVEKLQLIHPLDGNCALPFAPTCTETTHLVCKPVNRGLCAAPEEHPHSKRHKSQGQEKTGMHSKHSARDLLQASVPIQYDVQCSLSAFLDDLFLDIASGGATRSAAGQSLRCLSHPGAAI